MNDNILYSSIFSTMIKNLTHTGVLTITEKCKMILIIQSTVSLGEL